MKWPGGCLSAGAACGIKPAGLDLGLLTFDEAVSWAGVFTQNAAAAAPVRWSQARLGGSVRALVVNSGNANACTGRAGVRTVENIVAAASRELGCDDKEILVASTGPIGQPLDAQLIAAALPGLVSGLGPDADEFAKSILTTDTVTKTAEISGNGFSVTGVAKGAAMIAPNMATMLAFVVTDADVEHADLQSVLSTAVGRTFNRISIDGCESTNDSVFVFSTRRGSQPARDDLGDAVGAVCGSLAEQIVADAEGGTKILRISVEGTSDEPAAVALARSVADSVLWRAAAHGGDPNWGRILSALGSCDRSLDLADVSVELNGHSVYASGEPRSPVGSAIMAGSEIEVRCIVGRGTGAATVLTSDLSSEYVHLNATGTS